MMSAQNARLGSKGFVSIPVKLRFWEKVNIGDERQCWPWLAATDGNGRGVIWFNGKNHKAPRLAWSLRYGVNFPDDLHACHTCDNPSCCNPSHIWPGTRRQNFLDASRKGRLHVPRTSPSATVNKNKTHCKRGHEFTPENTRILKGGFRNCRQCAKIHQYERQVRARSGRAALEPPHE